MFARTERLLLRPGWEDDALALSKAIAHEEVAFKLASLPWPYSLENAQSFLRIERPESAPEFVIMLRNDGAPELIGGIGLVFGREVAPELGYWITPDHWGKGYVTEAARAVLDIARHTLRIPRLVSGHFADNPASGRVLRKLGFRPTGRIENRMCAAKGEARPCVLFQMELGEEDPECAMPIPLAA